MAPLFASSDSGISAPEPLEQQYQLYARELDQGTLDHLLLQLSVRSSSLQVSLLCPPLAEAMLNHMPACSNLGQPMLICGGQQANVEGNQEYILTATHQVPRVGSRRSVY